MIYALPGGTFFIRSLIRKIFLWLFLFFSVATIGAQGTEEDPEILFQMANQSYRQDDYTAAIAGYEKILDQGWVSSQLYFNLGTCYLHQKKMGPAVLYLERALLLAPGDADVEYNLSLARAQLKDEINEIPEFFLTLWWRQLALSLSANVWGILSLLLLFSGAFGIFVWQLASSRSTRKKGFIFGLPLLMLGLIPVFLAFTRIQLEDHSPFAIIQQQVVLWSAPDDSSNTIFNLHEGTKVEVLDEIDEWNKVRLMNGDQGWLKKNTLERI